MQPAGFLVGRAPLECRAGWSGVRGASCSGGGGVTMALQRCPGLVHRAVWDLGLAKPSWWFHLRKAGAGRLRPHWAKGVSGLGPRGDGDKGGGSRQPYRGGGRVCQGRGEAQASAPWHTPNCSFIPSAPEKHFTGTQGCTICIRNASFPLHP